MGEKFKKSSANFKYFGTTLVLNYKLASSSQVNLPVALRYHLVATKWISKRENVFTPIDSMLRHCTSVNDRLPT